MEDPSGDKSPGTKRREKGEKSTNRKRDKSDSVSKRNKSKRQSASTLATLDSRYEERNHEEEEEEEKQLGEEGSKKEGASTPSIMISETPPEDGRGEGRGGEGRGGEEGEGGGGSGTSEERRGSSRRKKEEKDTIGRKGGRKRRDESLGGGEEEGNREETTPEAGNSLVLRPPLPEGAEELEGNGRKRGVSKRESMKDGGKVRLEVNTQDLQPKSSAELEELKADQTQQQAASQQAPSSPQQGGEAGGDPQRKGTLRKLSGLKEVHVTSSLVQMLMRMGLNPEELTDKKLRRMFEGGGLFTFLLILLFLVVTLVGITVLDMVVSVHTTWNNEGLYQTSWGLIYVCFDFTWKAVVCTNAYPKALTKPRVALVIIVGCLVHLAIYLGNSVLSNTYGINFPLQVTGSFIASTFFKLTISVVVDIIVLPLIFNRSFIKMKLASSDVERPEEPESPKAISVLAAVAMTSMTSTATVEGTEAEAQAVAHSGISQMRAWAIFTREVPPVYKSFSLVGAATYFWVTIWLLFMFINAYMYKVDFNTFFEVNVPMMEVALWLGALVCLISLFLPHKRTLPYSVNFLMLYIWLITMMPFMCGSLFNAFRSLPQTSAVRFFVVVAYICLFEVIIFAAETTATRMSAEPFTICFVFPVQFFQYFYSALFFIDLGLESGVFWAILVLQSLWLTFRNSGSAKDTISVAFRRVSKQYTRLTNKTFFIRQADEEDLHRLVQQIQQAAQYLVCDSIVLVSVPVQFHVWASYLLQKDGELYVTCYSLFYQLTFQQTLDGELLKRFALIFGFKLFFHIVAHVVLLWKIRKFNQENDTKIRLFGVSTAFLRSQIPFILVLCISIQRLCYSIRSSLAGSDLAVDFTKCLYGNSSYTGYDSSQLYWDFVILDVFGVQ